MRIVSTVIQTITMIMVTVCFAQAQSRNNTKSISSSDGTTLSVTVRRLDGDDTPISQKELSIYENSVEQKVKNLSFDPSPSRILILVDNSQSLRAETEAIRNAVLEFAYEIYEGDQIFVLAFDEKAEIIQEWTDEAEKLRSNTSLFRKKGNPFLFDALSAASREVLVPLMPGNRKTAVVMITDGLDRGSKTSYDLLKKELQSADITVYALQIPDRTNGAFRRNQPKAAVALRGIVEATGGKIYDFSDAQMAAKEICDELKKNRYILSYQSSAVGSREGRTLFVLGNEGITVRSKSQHPGLD